MLGYKQINHLEIDWVDLLYIILHHSSHYVYCNNTLIINGLIWVEWHYHVWCIIWFQWLLASSKLSLLMLEAPPYNYGPSEWDQAMSMAIYLGRHSFVLIIKTIRRSSFKYTFNVIWFTSSSLSHSLVSKFVLHYYHSQEW